MNNVPRRIRLDLNTPAELSIVNAMQEVDKLPPDTRLTNAIILLAKAKELVSDFVDNVPASLSAGGPGENVSVPRDVVRNVLAVMEVNNPAYEDSINVLKKSLQQSVGGQSAGVWVKASAISRDSLKGITRFDIRCGKIMIENSIKYDQVHYDSLYKTWHDSQQRVLNADHLYILDESLQPATTGEGDETKYQVKNLGSGTWRDVEKKIYEMAQSGYRRIVTTSHAGFTNSPLKIDWTENALLGQDDEENSIYGVIGSIDRFPNISFVETGETKKEVMREMVKSFATLLAHIEGLAGQDLLNIFTTSPNATERQEGDYDYAEFQEWRKGVIPGTNTTGTDLYFYWLNNIKTTQ